MYLFSSPPNPSMNVFTVSMDNLNSAINATDSTFTQSAVEYMEANSPNLDTFQGHNGKIIYHHGESDPVFSMYDTENYYESLTSRYGASTADFARLFLIPGMNHCSGGLHTLDSFDPLTAIVNWVEAGKAPDSILASNSNSTQVTPSYPIPSLPSPPDTFLPVAGTRPLCPYPQFAQYTGSGNVDDAANFTCVAPTANAAPASKVKTIVRRK